MVIPWTAAEANGWDRHPDTVLTLEERVNRARFSKGLKIHFVSDKNTLLSNPEEPEKPKEWTPLVLERSKGTISLSTIIDLMEKPD